MPSAPGRGSPKVLGHGREDMASLALKSKFPKINNKWNKNTACTLFEDTPELLNLQ